MATTDRYRSQLVAGMAALELAPDRDQVERLLAFRDLLEKWNKAYNLTSVRNPDEMIARHLLDSLTIAPWVRAPRLLDVGSGGGLPVVPLAIISPETGFVALDSNSKKTRFLTQCKLELGLGNLQVVARRAEDFQPPQPFAQISSRAFTALANMVRWCGPLLSQDGEFLAMKGPDWAAEMGDLPTGWELAGAHPLQVPGFDRERHLLIIKRTLEP